MEYTLSIIKPDATKANNIGNIIAMIESKGFKLVAQKMIKLSNEKAQQFYDIHRERPFFNDLVEYMSSDYVVVQVLAKSNAVADYRELMGSTNPKDAKEDTIRFKYGKSIEENAVHGSDSIENAKREIKFFFNDTEINKIG